MNTQDNLKNAETLSEWLSETIADFLQEQGSLPAVVVTDALERTKALAPSLVQDAENAEEAAWERMYDPEAIAARQESYNRDLINAGRGHLIR